MNSDWSGRRREEEEEGEEDEADEEEEEGWQEGGMMTGGELYIYISIYGCIDPKLYTSIYVYMTRPPIFRGCRHMCASLSLAGCTVLFSFAGLRFTAVSMNVMHVICAGQPTANAAPLLFLYLPAFPRPDGIR